MAENEKSISSAREDDGDLLGYGAYADALWMRIEAALSKDLIKGELGDDPLVIGILGEWGSGKSHLLRLMHDQAKRYARERIGWHKRDTGFGLTVPVVFQPWKYEHEPHLHVPLMLHILHALQKYEKDAQVTTEKAKEWAGKQWEVAKKQVPTAIEKFKGIAKSAIAAMEPTTAIAANAALAVAGGLGGVLKPDTEALDPLKTFKYSDNGRFFYEMHEALKDVTRPTKKNGQKRHYGDQDIAINFVVFVDDLDRCLPEKAVQTLELIKTIFNIESFAFVLALDDEVIERGIGHRYQAYNFAGKKPEMPITGFEYLEKIVHLPFRLPALTEAQAKQFVRKYESGLESDAARQWFAAPVLAGTDGEGDIRKSGGDQAVHASPDLLDLAFRGFDAYVPRKLIRLVELIHQLARIKTPDGAYLLVRKMQGGSIDQRVLLVLVMVQLFQPELFRLIRRRDGVFTALLSAFAPDKLTSMAAAELDTAELSDVDLWRWVVFGARWQQDGNTFEPSDNPAHVQQRVQQQIAKAHANNAQESAYAQQRRMPLVAQIVEHRAAQRHVFDALKLIRALAEQVGHQASVSLKIRDYFSVLVDVDSSNNSTNVSSGTPATDRPRFAISNLSRVAQDLLFEREDVQAGIGNSDDLREGQWLQSQDVQRLVEQLRTVVYPSGNEQAPDTGKQRQLLKGLRYLAPYLAPSDSNSLWAIVANFVDLHGEGEVAPPDRALWGDVRAALGSDPRFDPANWWLPKAIAKDAATGFDTTHDKLPGFVEIKPAPFWFGSVKKTENIPSNFFIARTLTTVRQYQAFVEDSGAYADHVLAKAPSWLSNSLVSEESQKRFQAWRSKRLETKQNFPNDWQAQCANPLRPVVNLTWYESMAYVGWLSEKLNSQSTASSLYRGYVARLPDEFEWECAARFGQPGAPKPRPFPWVEGPGKADENGQGFAAYANIANLVGAPSTVGLYPKGNTPAGLTDMAGNAWEWMANPFVEDLDPQRSMFDLEAGEYRTLRGGSWRDDPGGARCSYRYWFLPDHWINDVGFRVVLSLPISKSGS